MKKIAILVPRGDVMPDAIVGAYFLLTQVNLHQVHQGNKLAFEVDIVGYQINLKLYDGTFAVFAKNFRQVEKVFDLIIVPGFTSEMDTPLRENRELIDWIKSQHLQHGTDLASMCTGAFLLAATGLLDGKKCTSHWAFEESFRTCFPAVNFLSDQIITDDEGIYASAGAYSSLNLILYLIEKFCGKETAVWAAKVFQLDIDRKSQKPFVIFNQQKSHGDQTIEQAQAYIEKHFDRTLNVKSLAKQFSVSRRSFIRRFKKATGNTPLEYIQRVRIEAAKRMLENTPKSIGEVMFQTGYNDSKTFRSLFKKFTGYIPSHYKSRYSRV